MVSDYLPKPSLVPETAKIEDMISISSYTFVGSTAFVACERMKPEHQGEKEGVIQVKMKICSE